MNSSQDKNYCCKKIDGHPQLKRQHNYYHQVQLQLYVERDFYSWCDLCLYTLKHISVERIYSSEGWQEKHIPKLEEYFDIYMVPEVAKPLFPVCTRSARAGPKIVLVPSRSMFKYYVCPHLEEYGFCTIIIFGFTL